MSIQKRYFKTKPICRVTFRLPADVAGDANRASVVGEFNDWDDKATPMKRLKSGEYKATLDLPVERGFQFRYLIDRERWVNDADADEQAPTPYHDASNSVITT